MNSVSPLFAFGFGTPWLLGWLAVAAAPILIHLWNKRKYREVPWAAIEYLLAAMRKNSRRMQLEQWLLLAVRTLIILLMVFAVAEPFLERIGLNFVTGQRTLKVLVIDGSYSMGYKPTDRSLFDRAKELAEQIVEESSQGDGFTLVLMGSPPTVVVGTPAMAARDFLEEIHNLKMPHGGGDLPATLTKVEEVIRNAESSGLVRNEVYFLTDLGRTSWAPDVAQSGGGSEAASEYQQRIERLGQMATLVVMDLGQASSENLAITSIRTTEPFATIARDVTIEAQVKNFGMQPRNHFPVEFFVDGRRVSETFVDVGAGEQSPVSLSYRFETAGDHLVEARLGQDLLDIDNHRWLSFRVKEFVRALCVNGKPGAGGMSGATDYLMLALNPEADGSSQGLVRADVISESSLLERDLAQYDCIFLCNVGQFTASEARVLDAYLKQGGGLVFFLGDQVLAERYNRVLADEKGVRVLPTRLKEVVAEAQYHFDPLGYRHPLVKDFQGREQAGLLTTPIYRYFKLEPPPSPKAKVALAFEGGDPAIVDEPIHRGRTFLVAVDGSLSSIDPVTKNPWTVMPAWPSFVPLVQEILAQSVGGQMKDRNVEVGQTIGDLVSATASNETVALALPDGRKEELRMQVDSEGSRWAFADTMLSGVYKAGLSKNTPEESFAVNVDTTESNLARLDPDELPKQFTTNKQSNLDEQTDAGVSRRTGLHKNLLYSVLGLLLFETFLAWRFGHATK